MAADVAEFLVNKFVKSLAVAEAEIELSNLIPISHFIEIKDAVTEVNSKFKLLAEDFSFSRPVIPALYELNDAMAECRIFANEYCNDELRNKKRHFLRFNPLTIYYFNLKMKKRLTMIRGDLDRCLTAMLKRSIVSNKSNGGSDRRAKRPHDWYGSKVLGFDEHAEKIEERLLFENGGNNNTGFTAIGVVGMAGVGKTTLVGKVFGSGRIQREFSPVAWVCLSDIMKEKYSTGISISIVRCILIELGHANDAIDEDSTSIPGLGRLLEMLNKVLSGKRYLIVLDDAWHSNDFYSDLGFCLQEGERIGDRDHLSHGLPKGSGGAVIVTSRIPEVARQLVGRSNLIPLQPLDSETCWRIFMETIKERNLDKSLYLPKIENEIKDQCHGLPLAVKTLAEIFINEYSFHQKENEHKKGMSSVVEAMIQSLTQRVLTALKDQEQCPPYFSDLFKQMKISLYLTRALLADRENLDHHQNISSHVKAALIELREVIYEADDVLTDCLVRHRYGKDGPYCSGFLLRNPLFLHDLGKKLRVINMHMKKIERTLEMYLSPRDHFIDADDSYQVGQFLSQEIIGLDNDVEMIKWWIFDTNKVLRLIGIVGMGGIGKTTIAQRIFHDGEIQEHFSEMIWVRVSQSFSAERVMRTILERLDKNLPGLDPDQMLSKIQQILRDKTCLIVMDDVWDNIDVDWWFNLCSALPRQSSCIVITTRIEQVAIRMGVENSRIYLLNNLNEEESWSFFSKFSFYSSKGVCPHYQLEDIGKKLLKKCGGLPVSIKALGTLMSSKINSPSKWEYILETFHALGTDGQTDPVMVSLKMSYDELSPVLRQCLLCFSTYPEDFDMHADQLMHWWIGEGLIQDKGSKTALEVGREYLAELIGRCLVEIVQQQGFDGRVSKCKIGNMVRQLITMIAHEEDVCSFDKQGRQKLTANSRWLCFSDEMDEKSLECGPKLRALLLMSSRRFDFDRSSEFLQSLRVLDLSKCIADDICVEDLFHWISSLKRLASLNLSGLKALREVPSSIHKLLNLQLLVLTGCSNLVKLHPSITNLKMLIILDLCECPLQYFPRGLGRLSYLQELSGFVVSHPRKLSAPLLEIKELTHLRVLRIHISDATVISDNELDVLSHLKELKVLAINTEDCRNIDVYKMLHKLTPPPSLQELYLRNYQGEIMPNWFHPKQLPRLQYLCIEESNLAELTCDNWDYLEGLCLKGLICLEVEWEYLKRVMPLLRYVEISHCYYLKDFPLCSVMEPGVWRKRLD